MRRKENRLKAIYQKLYSYFGPQHWWPGDSPFEVMVGAILTQNTSWANVEKAINNLKDNSVLEPRKLHSLSLARLSQLIRPSGYFNIKAKRLKGFLDFFFRIYKGDVKKMHAAKARILRRQLLSVNGIGPETADSILLYAMEKPVFVVDAYTKRVFSRHGLSREEDGYEKIQNLFMQNLNPVTNSKLKRKKNKICNGARRGANHVRNNKSCRINISNVVKLFNEYHALLVRLGKEFCLKARPKCDICPLKK